MAKMKGNMKRKGPKIPGADDFHQPPPGDRRGLDRLDGNETTYYDRQLRPGPRLSNPRKRGKRISSMRTANDAAMALSEAFRARCDKSSGAGYGGKSSFRWFKGVGYK
jgi:hypothetical protein